ncbi:MAG: phasin family protein [Pseudomonadota bacterium]|nr:phasin family protein [Pseudomonadota bacterium]
MAITPVTGTEAKIDVAKAEAAAEKAYAQAAASSAADVAPKAEPKIAAPAAAPVAKVSAPAAKVAAPKKAAAKKVAVKKVVAKKAATKLTPKKIVKPAAVKAPAKVTPFIKLKESIMTKTKTSTEDYTAKIKDVVATAQDRAKAAFEKTSAYATEYGEFTKGNLEAVVESGKILAAGLQDMGKAYVAEGKSAVETVTADVKEIAAIKSPADFFKLQGEMMRRNFDAAVATTSKNSEAMVKLMGDAFAPISTRVSLAVEKVKQAA